MGAGDVAPLITVGHGRLAQHELGALLTSAGVGLVVDVRRFPGSRLHPHVATAALAGWLPEVGVDYRWEPRLGGRRRLGRDVLTADPWWQVEAFRAYAAHTRSREFGEAIADVVAALGQERQVAILCSEAVWWRCHRRLVADVVALAYGHPVLHLAHTGALRAHEPSAGARLRADGKVVWDGQHAQDDVAAGGGPQHRR